MIHIQRQIFLSWLYLSFISYLIFIFIIPHISHLMSDVLYLLSFILNHIVYLTSYTYTCTDPLHLYLLHKHLHNVTNQYCNLIGVKMQYNIMTAVKTKWDDLSELKPQTWDNWHHDIFGASTPNRDEIREKFRQATMRFWD